MANGIYLFLVLLTSLAGIIFGFRKGITRQIPSLLGFAFGAVCARVLTPEYSSVFHNVTSGLVEPHFVQSFSNLLCAACIYFTVYWIFNIFTGVLRGALSVFEVGMFNRLLGAFFSLVCSLLWLSIAFNIMLCIFPDSGLMKYEKSDDGNMVASVMAMTPAILGCCGADDFAHLSQLKEASTISCNFNDTENVIIRNVQLYCNVKDI